MRPDRNGFYMSWKLCTLVCLMTVLATPVFAAENNLLDEARFRQLAGEMRCLVCQNQSIADSSAGLAVDLRGQIHEQMAAGKTDDEIRAYMVSRYGDFILYSPPLKAATLILWLGPFGLLLLALGLGMYVVRRRSGLSGNVAEGDEGFSGKAEALWQKEGRK